MADTAPRRKTGFTLIELLVVIAIIGILSSIILVSLNSARAQARDARRISDIQQLRLALELYYDACGVFPVNIYGASANANYCNSNGTTNNGLVANGFISQVPTDPNGGNYSYVPLGSGLCSTGATSYHLGASLETSNINLESDADAARSSGTCTGFSDFSGLSYASGGSLCNATAGVAYTGSTPTATTETCYDVVP